MRFAKIGFSVIPACTFGLRIEVNGDVSLPDPSDPSAPEPIMQSFANHLHSVAGLFSSIIGKQGSNSQDTSFYNPACYHPETEDSEFPNWSGPYCLISYDDTKTCGEEFNCNFLQSYNIKLPSSSKLCCRNTNDPWSSKFQEDTSSVRRVFSTMQDPENLPSNAKSTSGHYSLNEIIFNARVKPDSELYLNKFDMGSACKMWGESLGYYSLNPVPENGNYQVANNDNEELAVCAMERKFQVAHGGKEVPSIMPFCSFKITGQTCPDYAPLFLTFPKNVVSLPNDDLFKASSWIDSSGLCCSLTQHKTIDQTVVNLDYLPSNWTMNDFQVIKWPYASCPIFEFPKMDLIEHNIEYSGNTEYPWAFSDLKFSMCQYRTPVAKEAEDEEKEEEQVEEEQVEEEQVDLVTSGPVVPTPDSDAASGEAGRTVTQEATPMATSETVPNLLPKLNTEAPPAPQPLVVTTEESSEILEGEGLIATGSNENEIGSETGSGRIMAGPDDGLREVEYQN